MASRSTEDRLCNALLLLLILFSLPATVFFLWFNYAAVVLIEQRARVFTRQKRPPRKTIFITGASTAYGLNLAQAFYGEGYKVIAADLDRCGVLNIARRSRAITKNYRIPPVSAVLDASYAARCLFIVAKQERADLWVDCSQDISLDIITAAQQQIRKGTACVCIAADNTNAQLLESKEMLLNFIRNKQLPAPEVHVVRSRGEIHNVLNSNRGRKRFLLKSPDVSKSFNSGTVLPCRTISQTYNEVSLVKIGPTSQMVLEEYFDPSNTYQCSAVVVRGLVKQFWARQRTGTANDNFGPKSALWRALRAYTESLSHELGQTFTSHLTLLFLLNEGVTNAGVVQQVLPIEGSIHLDPTFLFPRSRKAPSPLVLAYMSALDHGRNGASNSVQKEDPIGMSPIEIESSRTPRYFLSTDFKRLAIEPCVRLLSRQTSPAQLATSVWILSQRLLFGDEAYYDFYDPMPAFWRNTVVVAWETVMGA